jgi:hypothetical protein
MNASIKPKKMPAYENPVSKSKLFSPNIPVAARGKY